MRRSPWLLLVLIAACSGFQKPAENRRPVGSLERLKTDPKGVCGSLSNLGFERWTTKKNPQDKLELGEKLLNNTVEACARIWPGGNGPGEGAVLAVSLAFIEADEHWRPEYWHFEVVRSNGLVLQAGNLGAGSIEDGVCLLGTCNKEGHASVVLDEPWHADRYKIRLTHVPTRKRVEVFITLN